MARQSAFVMKTYAMAGQGAKKATKVEIQEKLRSFGAKVTGSEEELEESLTHLFRTYTLN